MADTNQRPNPFLHAHDHDHHGHDHRHHDDETLDALDPAQQSLSDALRVSFTILKGIMLLLVLVYCFTGIFSVDASEVAIRLRFGRIVGDATGPRVYTTGWYFGWPYPIEQKIYVPVATQRTVRIDEAFWFQVNPRDAGKPLDQLTPQASGLNPQRDGSLLTGDANIIHAQFDVKYRITDAVLFLTHVGDLDKADALVAAAAQEGIVAAVARTDTDSVLKKLKVASVARQHAQRVLDGMASGITITGDATDPDSATGVIVRTPTMPLSVRPAYYEGNNAESQRAQRVSDARTARTTTLNAAAGPAHDELFRLIQSYEYHHAAGDDDMAEQIAGVLDEAFDRLRVSNQTIGGEAARIINEARTERTEVVQQIISEVQTFKNYLPAYRDNPRLLKTSLWQQAREEIFTGDVETFYADGQPYIVLNRDPQVQRRREQERLKQAQEAGQPQPGR